MQNQNDQIALEILDNGRGFDSVSLSDMEALGVAGMRERAGLVGGSLEVESRPGKGTRVCFSAPFDLRARVAI